jgi:UDP-N-acetylmuramate dehydrogenase
MNAGCYNNDVGKNLVSADAIDYEGNFYKIKNADFKFFYRGSEIGKKFIFTKAVFKIIPSSSSEVNEKIKELQKQRESSQPIRAKTGGSTFKNPQEKKAWELIDAIGFRGKKIGGAKFSEKHCNFLINADNATAKDLVDLGEEARKEVFKKFGLKLEWELKQLK